MYKKFAAFWILILLVIGSFHLSAFAQNTEELLHVNVSEKNEFWTYPEQEDADYTCIGKFVTEEAEGFVMTDEPYEYRPGQLQDTRVYQLECIDRGMGDVSETYEYDHYYIMDDGNSDIITYVYVLMEKSYFEQNFAYDQPFTLKLKGTEERIEFVTEEGEIDSIPLLSLYDQETGKYLNSASLEGLEGFDPMDEVVQFHGSGYFEEWVAPYENLESIMPDAGIYTFHILQTMDEITEDDIYVVCGKNFYEDNRDNGIEILYARNYGLEYDGQPVWFLMSLTTQEYNTIRIYELDEMKSWGGLQSNTEASQDETSGDGQEGEVSASDEQKNNTGIFGNIPAIVWAVAGVAVLAAAGGIYALNHKKES